MKKFWKKKNISAREKSHSNGKALAMVESMAVAFAITCILFLVCGILLTYTFFSEAAVPTFSLATTAFSAAVAGFDWAKSAEKKGLLHGLLAGLIYGVLLLTILWVLRGGLELSSAVILPVALAGGGIGGVLGINLKRS